MVNLRKIIRMLRAGATPKEIAERSGLTAGELRKLLKDKSARAKTKG